MASESVLIHGASGKHGEIEVATESADLSAWLLFFRESGSSQKDTSSVRAAINPRRTT
jgi:hypothetical protein